MVACVVGEGKSGGEVRWVCETSGIAKAVETSRKSANVHAATLYQAVHPAILQIEKTSKIKIQRTEKQRGRA